MAEKYIKKLVRITRPLPLVGHIAFGIIDRGTNLLQVRPYSACHLSCVFCSVDAGPLTRSRISEYIVDVGYLLEWVLYVSSYKVSRRIHVLIDGVGEPLLHPQIEDLVAGLRSMGRVGEIAVETHGAVLSESLIERLRGAGLTRLNISIDSLDRDRASTLAGAEWYDVKKVSEMALYANSTGIDVMITPVWLPGFNDRDIEEIAIWAKNNLRNRYSPILGIQKYVAHKRGRKPPGIREPSWGEFYSFLEALEARTGVKLRISLEDFGVRPDNSLPKPMGVGEKVIARIYSPGWLKGEYLGYSRGRAIAILHSGDLREGEEVMVRIIHNKDNIYLARPVA
jgi:uncharacterized Fe-S cluster-containing radical SAM superfamily enzyme